MRLHTEDIMGCADSKNADLKHLDNFPGYKWNQHEIHGEQLFCVSYFSVGFANDREKFKGIMNKGKVWQARSFAEDEELLEEWTVRNEEHNVTGRKSLSLNLFF